MSAVNDILNQLKTKQIRKEANKVAISKAIKEKFGIELPLLKSKSGYDREDMIDIINTLFDALAEAVE